LPAAPTRPIPGDEIVAQSRRGSLIAAYYRLQPPRGLASAKRTSALLLNQALRERNIRFGARASRIGLALRFLSIGFREERR